MPSKENQELEQFLVIVQKGVRKHGIRKIVRVIRTLDLDSNSLYIDDILEYVIKVVCEEFCIEKDEIYSKKRGIVTIARKIIIVVIHKHLKISDAELGMRLDRDRTLVYKTRKEVDDYDRENPLDAPFFQRYDRVN